MLVEQLSLEELPSTGKRFAPGASDGTSACTASVTVASSGGDGAAAASQAETAVVDSAAAAPRETKWATRSELHSVGLTAGMVKVLRLVDKHNKLDSEGFKSKNKNEQKPCAGTSRSRSGAGSAGGTKRKRKRDMSQSQSQSQL